MTSGRDRVNKTLFAGTGSGPDVACGLYLADPWAGAGGQQSTNQK